MKAHAPMLRGALLQLTLICLACGSGASSDDELSQTQLRLVRPDPLTMSVEQRLEVIITAFYAGQAPLQYSVEELPPFASLQGNHLTLAPQRLRDEGFYMMTVKVTDGQVKDSQKLGLMVERTYWPPQPSIPWMTGCPGWTCSGCPQGSGSYVEAYVVDPDNDDVSLEIEVIPEGGTFTGVPNYQSAFAPVSIPPTDNNFHLTLSGLTAGAWYRGKMRGMDSTGTASQWLPLCDGRSFQGLAP